MYTREEILNSYKEISFPKSIFEEPSLQNKDIIFYSKSKPPLSSVTKDTSSLSESYVLPWRIVQQKNNKKNVEFFRAGNFTPSEPKEPVIEIKIENFKKIYEKFGIPLEKKIIYLKKGNNISGPYNQEELDNLYKTKKYDSNYEFRTIDLFTCSEEEPFVFHSLKNINEENWEENYVDTPLLEYSALYSKVKELLEASKKRKVEINALNEEIIELKNNNEEKDKTIIELTEKIKTLEKELSEQKEVASSYKQKDETNKNEPEVDEKKEENEEKKEDIKVEVEEKIEIVSKNFLYNNTTNTKKPRKKKRKKEKEKAIENENENGEEEKEKEEIPENQKEKIEIQPKVLDMGEEWEVAGKKKKKPEKEKEEPKVVGIPIKEEPKVTNDLNKSTGSNKSKKNTNKISADELVELLRPKKKEVKEVIKNEIKNDEENSNNEVKPVKGKGKKKNKKKFEDTDIALGFKY